MAIARAISLLVAWVAVAVDLSLLVICVLGLEIGGLNLVPSLIVFTLAHALSARGRGWR